MVGWQVWRRFTGVAMALALWPAQTQAFSGTVNFDRTIFNATCIITYRVDSVNETAMVRIEPAGAPEGTAFIDGTLSTVSSPLGAWEIQNACGINLISNIVQNGADGTFDTDGYMGIRFRGMDQSGRFYDYEVALTGVTNTQVVYSRDLVNFPPVAWAGPDQTVDAGAAVTLDGSASTDPENQPLGYAWTQTAGPGVVLSDATAAAPVFTAPDLPFNAAPVVLTFSLAVNDGAQDSPADTMSVTVTAPVDVDAPTVTLAGLPATMTAGEAAQVSVTFSEAVTGLDLADFQVAGATLSGLSGSGVSYTVTVTASGAGDVTVGLPADVVVDQAGNGNLASNLLQAGSTVVEETEASITGFLQSRANSLVAAQPDLIPFLTRGKGSQVQVSRGAISLRLAAGRNLWLSVQGHKGESGTRERDYLLAAIGGHVWLNDRTVLGAMVEADRAIELEPGQRIEGEGWLAGPYLAGQLGEQPLFYEARLLWGRSENTLQRPGLIEDRFGSDRLLAQAKVEGELRFGELILRPSLDASHVRDRVGSYVDGLGNPIAGQEVRQTQAALGVNLVRNFTLGAGTLTPDLGLAAVYSDTRGLGGAAGVLPPHDGWRGRVEFGLTLERPQSLVEASVFVDGLGADDYSDHGFALQLSAQF